MDSALLTPAPTRLANTAHEHPLDVLRFAKSRLDEGLPCAIVMITGTDGGAVRNAGTLMAVTEDGVRCGYLSGGCIDADIALNAQKAIASRTALTLRYGRGSPFTDIRLPCGGGIDLVIVPNPSLQTINATIGTLETRTPTVLSLDELIGGTQTDIASFTATYRPKLKLRIAGIGADPIALLQLATSAGIEASLWSQDEDCRANAAAIASVPPIALTTPRALPETGDDPHTAFILMAHDPDWETPLLTQALAGKAFYIGAVGSPNTHRLRCETLRAAGLTDADITRIHGPVGLVPSMRDASMLAISCLAEIIASFHQEVSQ